MAVQALTTQQAPYAHPAHEASAADTCFEIGWIVEAPDGARGRVVGFYRTETPTVLVAFDRGETHQFLPTDLRLPGARLQVLPGLQQTSRTSAPRQTSRPDSRGRVARPLAIRTALMRGGPGLSPARY